MKLRWQLALCLAIFGLLALALTNWFVALIIVTVGIIVGLRVANWRLERRHR